MISQCYLLGDMGSGYKEQFLVSKAMKKHIEQRKGMKDIFVCGLGDNIYPDGCDDVNDEQFIEKFEKPYKNISDDIKQLRNDLKTLEKAVYKTSQISSSSSSVSGRKSISPALAGISTSMRTAFH